MTSTDEHDDDPFHKPPEVNVKEPVKEPVTMEEAIMELASVFMQQENSPNLFAVGWTRCPFCDQFCRNHDWDEHMLHAHYDLTTYSKDGLEPTLANPPSWLKHETDSP